MSEYDVNSKLTRREDEPARDFLSRRLFELEKVRSNLIWDKIKENEDELSDYLYCMRTIPDIEADLRSKSDEQLEGQLTWEFSPNYSKCGLLVDEIPGPTRIERGLEELPCKYEECVCFGKCWASIPGLVEPIALDTGLIRLWEKQNQKTA